jgi:hypothetical protein
VGVVDDGDLGPGVADEPGEVGGGVARRQRHRDAAAEDDAQEGRHPVGVLGGEDGDAPSLERRAERAGGAEGALEERGGARLAAFVDDRDAVGGGDGLEAIDHRTGMPRRRETRVIVPACPASASPPA